jgi:ankyrin repeat protein
MVEMNLDDFGFANLINNSCGELARTPLLHTISSRKLDVMQLMLSRGTKPDCVSQVQTLLHLLAVVKDEHHAVECLKLLNVSQRVDLNTSADYPDITGSLTAFETALFCGNLLVADYLLSQGADVQGPHTLEPHFLSLLISQPSWYSLQALEYYMGKSKPSFIIRPKNQLSALHVAASMQSLLADTTTVELKLEILLKISRALIN